MREILYTFYDTSKGRYNNREETIKHINKENYTKFEYTYGLEYRSPTTNHVPITKEKAIQYIEEGGFVDVELLENNTIHINRYSANDMW